MLLMQRTPQQEAEEAAILEQAKAIEAVRRAEEAANRPAQAGRSSPPAGLPPAPLISFLFAHAVCLVIYLSKSQKTCSTALCKGTIYPVL